MRNLTPLCKLAAKHQTDKGGRHMMYAGQPCHCTHEYTPIYWDLFNAQRELVRNVLEIGVNKGCSLRMWEEFFQYAKILGLDNDPSTLFKEGRIVCLQADQRDPHSLCDAVLESGMRTFDVIIDDGSHLRHDQAISVATLAPFLSNIGVYVIEDIPKDREWADFIAGYVPHGMHYGLVYPELGQGEDGPQQLFIITR